MVSEPYSYPYPNHGNGGGGFEVYRDDVTAVGIKWREPDVHVILRSVHPVQQVLHHSGIIVTFRQNVYVGRYSGYLKIKSFIVVFLNK